MTTYERFLQKVNRANGRESCHLWMASVDQDGYGWFWADGRAQKAHRWILGYLRGNPLRPYEMACHTCDTPSCCNPVHLYVGTAADNARDRTVRGRGRTNGYDLKTHCSSGHPFTAENTYHDPRGFRQCRSCASIRRRAYKLRRSA